MKHRFYKAFRFKDANPCFELLKLIVRLHKSIDTTAFASLFFMDVLINLWSLPLDLAFLTLYDRNMAFSAAQSRFLRLSGTLIFQALKNGQLYEQF